MDVACRASSRFLFLPVRDLCVRWCGPSSAEMLEDLGRDVVVSSSSASSQARSRPTDFGAPFPPLSSDQIRSRLIRRILDQPGQQGRAAQLAAAGVRHAVRMAQVIGTIKDNLNYVVFVSGVKLWFYPCIHLRLFGCQARAEEAERGRLGASSSASTSLASLGSVQVSYFGFTPSTESLLNKNKKFFLCRLGFMWLFLGIPFNLVIWYIIKNFLVRKTRCSIRSLSRKVCCCWRGKIERTGWIWVSVPSSFRLPQLNAV